MNRHRRLHRHAVHLLPGGVGTKDLVTGRAAALARRSLALTPDYRFGPGPQ